MSYPINFDIDKNTDFSKIFYIEDDNGNKIDYTNYTGVSKIKKHPQSTNYISLNFIGGNGSITLFLNANQTANVVCGKYMYDCYVTSPDGKVNKVLYGNININPSISI